jgi:DNA-directed RNA polymerase subunit K/omega
MISSLFDCEKVRPTRFTLVLAAAARGRALRQGAEPRSERPAATAIDRALLRAGRFDRQVLVDCPDRVGRT